MVMVMVMVIRNVAQAYYDDICRSLVCRFNQLVDTETVTGSGIKGAL